MTMRAGIPSQTRKRPACLLGFRLLGVLEVRVLDNSSTGFVRIRIFSEEFGKGSVVLEVAVYGVARVQQGSITALCGLVRVAESTVWGLGLRWIIGSRFGFRFEACFFWGGRVSSSHTHLGSAGGLSPKCLSRKPEL